ncbi:response regulator [Paenibacillus sp. 2TAB19]|uniref:response regulator n=1 Tax=Paenibacillus sp. 2TAB19 TaxID=3233003 RepID=UPI003F9B7F83
MKALIIDDEKHVREAIRLLVPWDSFEIGTLLEAQDGQSAIELIEKEKPEIIFTDMMMPNMDGTKLLEWAAKHAPASKIIVISGHDDFSFVRTTVKYGGIDYILKPIDAEQLTAALATAIDSWKREEKERSRSLHMNMELNQLKPIFLEQYFSTLISEPGNHPAFAETMEQELGLTLPMPHTRIAVVSLELSPPAVRTKFAAGLDLLFFALTNICNEFLRVKGLGYAFRYRGNEMEMALLLWGEAKNAPELLGEINEAIFKALKTRFVFGIGLPNAFPNDAAASYQQAKLALQRRNLLGSGSDLHFYEPSTAHAAKNPLLMWSEHEERIRFAVQSGQQEQIRRAMQPWFDALDQSGYVSLEQLGQWRQQFELAKSMWETHDDGATVEKNAGMRTSNAYPLPVTQLGQFDYEQWKHSVFDEACQSAKRIAERDKESGVIYDIAKYIEQHVHSDITLQEIASRFFLSREYISRKFKQEMNENISDFIAKCRIKRAKELLANGQLRITQIAEQVGFQDEKYFSKVFKKWTDCSPNDYRKRHYGDDGGGGGK